MAIVGKEYYRLSELAELWSTADRTVTSLDLVHFAVFGHLLCFYRLDPPLVLIVDASYPDADNAPYYCLGLDEENDCYRMLVSGFVRPTRKTLEEIEIYGSALLHEIEHPQEVSHWAVQWESGSPIPLVEADELLVFGVEAHQLAEKLGLSSVLSKADSEALAKNTKAIVNDNGGRQSVIHRQRCRAIAELLWKSDPERTIKDLIFCDEITAIACEGHVYLENTVRDWIKDLCPNRKPGRPRKKKLQASS